ncbi:MAG: hypothetical protein ACOC8E_07630, partial [Planctomycetota bacterium]
MKPRADLLLIMLGLASATACASARADGFHLPTRSYVDVTSVPDVASIPTQRALVSFRDGTETLIVESAFSSDSPEVAWVLPLPARPTGLEPVPAGALKTLSYSLGPRVIHGEVPWFASAAIGAMVVVFLSLLTLLPRPHPHPLRQIVYRSILLGLLALLLSAMLLPSLGKARHEATGPDTLAPDLLRRTTTVGSYRVHVLTPGSPAQLDRWLTAPVVVRSSYEVEQAYADALHLAESIGLSADFTADDDPGEV